MSDMIEKTVVRGKVENGRFAAFNLHIDGNRLYSEYGLEYIRETVKLLLTEEYAKYDEPDPERLDNRLKEMICGTVAKAAHRLALRELKRIILSGPDEVKKVVEEVMLGGKDE